MSAHADTSRLLASRIRAARREMPEQNGRKVSQAKLADRLGVHWVTVSNWETGKATPSLENLVALAEETGKPVSFFTDDDEDEEQALLRQARELEIRGDYGMADELRGIARRMARKSSGVLA